MGRELRKHKLDLIFPILHLLRYLGQEIFCALLNLNLASSQVYKSLIRVLESIVEVVHDRFLVFFKLRHFFFYFIQFKSVKVSILTLLELENREWQLIKCFKHRHEQFTKLKYDPISSWIAFAEQ